MRSEQQSQRACRPQPERARRGYVVFGIDNYFNGERKGTGPAGDMETMAKGSDQEMSLFKITTSSWGARCGE